MTGIVGKRDRHPSHRVYTIGHSTRAIEEFIMLLKEKSVESLVDIRTIPKSRHNPQFSRENLHTHLADTGLKYLHMTSLGGLRPAKKGSENLGWRNASFRGFADYMQTEEFERAVLSLIGFSRESRTAVMCAEAVPWRCHRSLVADPLVAHGIEVVHIMGPERVLPHKLTQFAVLEGTRVKYPAAEQSLF